MFVSAGGSLDVYRKIPEHVLGRIAGAVSTWLQPRAVWVISSLVKPDPPYILGVFWVSSIPIDSEGLLNLLFLSCLCFLLFIDQPAVSTRSRDIFQAYRYSHLFYFHVFAGTLVLLLTSKISMFFEKKTSFWTFYNYRHIRKYF